MELIEQILPFIIPLMITFAGLLFFPLAVQSSYKKFEGLTEENTGEIYKVVSAGSGGDVFVQIKHEIEGKEYINYPLKGTPNNGSVSPGDKIIIVYDPAYPSRFVEASKLDEYKESARKQKNMMISAWGISIIISVFYALSL